MTKSRLATVLIVAMAILMALPVAAQKIAIGAVLFGRDSFFQSIQQGMEKAAKDAGVTLLVSVHDHDIAKETSFIEDYVARGVKAIVITPESVTASVPAIQKAFEAGVKIICFNTNINDADAKKYVSAFYTTDQTSLGQQTGKYLVGWLPKHIKGDVNVGILNCERFDACKARGDGFRKALTDAKVKWTEVTSQEGFMPDVGSNVAESILQANPKINILWSENEGGTVGEVIAVRTMNLQNKVFVFGTDISTQLADFLLADDNILQAVTGQSPALMGGNSVKAAIDIAKGKKVTPVNNVVANAFFSRSDPKAVQAFKDSQ